MNLVEDFVNIGEPFSKHVRKAQSTFNMKRFFDLLNKLLMRSIGLLIGLSWMTSLLQTKTQLLDLTEFPTVSIDVLVALAQSSSFMPIKPFWSKEYS